MVGFCSCNKGKDGSFCKHQSAVFNLYRDKMPNLLTIGRESCYFLTKLALRNGLITAKIDKYKYFKIL